MSEPSARFIVTREADNVRDAGADPGRSLFVERLHNNGSPVRYTNSLVGALRMVETAAFRVAYLAAVDGEEKVRVHESVTPDVYWRAVTPVVVDMP